MVIYVNKFRSVYSESFLSLLCPLRYNEPCAFMEKQRYFKTRRAADTRVDVLFLENKTKVYPPWKKKRREKEQHGQSATLPCPPLEPLATAGDG